MMLIILLQLISKSLPKNYAIMKSAKGVVHIWILIPEYHNIYIMFKYWQIVILQEQDHGKTMSISLYNTRQYCDKYE